MTDPPTLRTPSRRGAQPTSVAYAEVTLGLDLGLAIPPELSVPALRDDGSHAEPFAYRGIPWLLLSTTTTPSAINHFC